jgi:hypothetical protein
MLKNQIEPAETGQFISQKSMQEIQGQTKNNNKYKQQQQEINS